MRLGFIGLGIMGRPMAKHLIAAGHSMTVWNRSRPGIDDVVAAGGVEAASPADVARASEVVFTMVGDSPDVEAVALGDNGILARASAGLVHVDCTTISPGVTREIAAKYAERGVLMLDAPVSGGEGGAVNAALSIMVGGPKDVFDKCLPLLESMSKMITYWGEHGAGQITKLCNQVAVAGTNMAVCEALVLAAKSGVSRTTVLQAISGGAVGFCHLIDLAPMVVQGDFQPGFKVWHQ